MPVEATVSIPSPSTKRGSIVKRDNTALTLPKKGEDFGFPGPHSSSSVIAAALRALADNSNSSIKELYLPPIHAPPGPRTNHFPRKNLTSTKIAAERKVSKEMKKKEAEEKKTAAAERKIKSLAKKQEKRVSSAKAKASVAAAKAETLCEKLAEVMKAAAVPDVAAHHHKKIKGMCGSAPTMALVPSQLLVLSPQHKPMSAKKKVNVQSPLRCHDKGEDSSSDESIASGTSGKSSGVSTTMTEGNKPLLLQHASQGCGDPAQGREGRRHAVPVGRGRGGQTGGRLPPGSASVDEGSLGKASHQSLGVVTTGTTQRDYLWALGGSKKNHGSQATAGQFIPEAGGCKASQKGARVPAQQRTNTWIQSGLFHTYALVGIPTARVCTEQAMILKRLLQKQTGWDGIAFWRAESPNGGWKWWLHFSAGPIISCSHPHGAINSSTNSTTLFTSSGYIVIPLFTIAVQTASHYPNTMIS
jgi:hypothetical protein